MKKNITLAVAYLLLFSQTAFAEVMGHNPDLDYKCGEGFQWSRKTVACEQANCPPGAGRTYTLECNCGEAWNKPFRTCYGDVIGLATHCIPNTQTCDEVKGGFDPVTGDCKFMEGYAWNKDNTACVREYPSKIKCKIVNPQGDPLKDTELTLAEYGNNPTNPTGSSKSKTNSSGEIELDVTNRQSNLVKIIMRNGNGYYRTMKELKVDQTYGQECVMTVYTNDQVEKWIKDEYISFLTDSCLSKEQLDKIKNANIVFGADVPTSRYDSENKQLQISAGDMGNDWNSLSRALMHEFGHLISDQIIDPTDYYVKGYPFTGKYVGGSHENWVPNKVTNNWGPDIDAEQLAFEEALADFMANQYFASKGQTYQEDLATPDRAAQAVTDNGRDASSRTEGVISSFLIEFYKNQTANNPKSAAQAVGDFIETIKAYKKNSNAWFPVPARTIKEFIDSKNKRTLAGDKSKCTPTSGETGNLKDLSNKYGFDGNPKQVIKFNPKNTDQRAKINDTLSGMTFNNPDPTSITNLIPIPGTTYEFPKGTGPIIEFYPSDYADGGQVQRISFDPNSLNMFTVDPTNVLNIQQGTAHVQHADVNTPNLKITRQNTEYYVSVTENNENIEVIDGTITATTTDANLNIEPKIISTGEKTSYTPDKGFYVPEKSQIKKTELVNTDSQNNDDLIKIITFAAAGLVMIVALIFVIRKRK